MPTSGSLMTLGRTKGASNLGFTLLELTIVMVLVGLIGIAVVPNFPVLGEALSRNQELRSIKLQLEHLGDRAFADATAYYLVPEGQEIELRDLVFEFEGEEVPRPFAPKPATLSMAEGWTVIVPDPIIFYRSGLCSGGEIQVRYAGTVRAFDLFPPDCDRLEERAK